MASRRFRSFPALTPGLGKLLRSSAKLTRAALKQGAAVARQAQAVVKTPEVSSAGRPRGRFVQVEGIRVHCIVRGRGRPVVLLHGNGTMAEDFVLCGLLDQLAARYRVIAVDRPGFGRTKRPRHRLWTAAAQAHLVAGVLARLKVERPVVVAHSWGTLVALSLAAQNACDLRGLVLLSGYFFPEQRADLALSAPLAVPGYGDTARAVMPLPMRELMARQAFRHVFSPQSVPARFKTRFPVEIALGREQLRACAEDTASMNSAAAWLHPHYRHLKVPLVIMAGDADRIVDTAAHSCRLHREAPESTLTVLPGKGHMIHYFAKSGIGRAVDGLMDPAGRPRARRTRS
ncbi:alpha/beta hydrolase [Enterovirga sp.]|uniref:alpha/beta fold hydrolase n=1 Tax=Enterovirga sp. TaxID=2026350 RepID=UPI002BDEB772|nr:alpha/beta hydrolase [Enterovirga sp.]HMO31281.1 alpha/beta hydrolase [Enterovirga sp.]